MSEADTDNVVPIRQDGASFGGPGSGAGDGPGDGKTGERLAALEVHANVIREEIRDHVATKSDISSVKQWMVLTMAGGALLIITVISRMMGG